jgi:hypothetical protein
MIALSKRRRYNRIAAVLALSGSTLGLAVLAGVLGGVAPAGADPASTTAVVGVGADVTQDLFAALGGASPAPGLGATSGTFDQTQYYTPLESNQATGNQTIQSYDANAPGELTTQASAIITTYGGPAFDRPDSSTSGIKALEDEVTGTGWEQTGESYTGAAVSLTGQIQFARSARGPKTDTNGYLTFIPYGRDGLGILFYDHGDGAISGAPLTSAFLQSLYSPSGNGTATLNGDTVEGCLTISGSTPRSNLENALDISDSTTLGYSGCRQITQNSGNAFFTYASTLGANTDAVIPISVGSWIGQANGVGVDRSNEVRGVTGYGLASITDGTTALGSPTTGSGSSLAPSTTYYQDQDGTTGGGPWGYDVYTVVPTSDLSGAARNTVIISLFDGSSSSLCSTSAQTRVNLFGFDSLQSDETGYPCGNTSTQGDS